MNKELSEILTGFKRALTLMGKPEKASLLFASLIMIVTGALTNFPALILGQLTDTLIKTPNIQFNTALPFIGLILLIIIIRESLNVIRKYFVENVATQTEKKQTVAVIEHLLKTDISTINQQQIGSLHGRIFRSIQGLVQIIKLGFLDFLPVFFTALVAIIIALIQKPFLASIMILVIPLGLLIILKQISSQKGIRVFLLRGKEKIDGSVVEMLSGIETVRVLNTYQEEVSKIDSITENLRQKEIKHHIFMALFDAAKYLNEGIFYVLVISLSIYFAAQGIISKGDILVYSILFSSITAPLREIHRILDQSHESSILVNDLYGLLNEPKDISFNSSPSQIPVNSITVIEASDLSYKYAEHPEIEILKHINLKINAGEKIGIAGTSGCGKTTFIRILLRLIHNYKGQIKLFGEDLQNITRDEIAQKIAYVPQKTYIFSGTIKENVVYGSDKNPNDQDVIEAVKKANIYHEIKNNLGGLEGRVSENGNNLSGGQKQRLALARLILKSPEVLIFDEATSALDNTNETIVLENIEHLFKDKTLIIIAHRLTTLKSCNRILVFGKGKIVQEGNYQDLSNNKGLFQEFLLQRSSKKV